MKKSELQKSVERDALAALLKAFRARNHDGSDAKDKALMSAKRIFADIHLMLAIGGCEREASDTLHSLASIADALEAQRPKVAPLGTTIREVKS